MKCLVPVFLGGLSSLVLCAYLVLSVPVSRRLEPAAVVSGVDHVEVAAVIIEEEDAWRLFTSAAEEKRDLIREMYQEPGGREWVMEFFTHFCNSREIARVILANADKFDIPPALAFALSWEESRFNPLAVNARNKDESIDRGLFQLNNRSFPKLKAEAFFDPEVNAWYGMNHLRHCLNTGGSEIAALALYNAGAGKVKNTGAPKHTLDYIHRILENRLKIEARFEVRIQQEAERRIAEKTGSKQAVGIPDADFLTDAFSEEIAEVEPVKPRLLRLTPLGCRR
jgi:hypothetical protein